MILSFVSALLVFAFIELVFVLILCKAKFGPRINHLENLLVPHLNIIVALCSLLFALVTVYSATINESVPTAWYLLYGLLVGLLVLDSLIRKSADPRTISIALLIPVAITLMSFLMKGPMPTGQDEGRFAGFAYRIVQDGRWQSGVYSEATYYQFFHIVPYLMATLSIVTGLDVNFLVHPSMMLIVSLTMSLSIYVVIRNLGGKQGSRIGILGPVLLLSTPPIAALQFIPQILAEVLFLTAMILVSLRTYTKSGRFLSLLIVSIIGVITHATYPLLLLSMLIPMSLAFGGRGNKIVKSGLLKSVIKIVSVFALAYYGSVLVLDQLVGTGKTFILSLLELLTGEIEPFTLGRQMWYSAVSPEIAFSWVLVLSLAATYVIVKILDCMFKLRSVQKVFGHLKSDWLVGVTVAGVLWLGFGLMLRSSYAGWGARYFFPFYLLLLPASAVVIGKIARKRRIINTAIIVVIIAVASFYALQDPALSVGPNNILLVADKRSWNVAEDLALNVSLNTSYRLDPRVEIPFQATVVKSTPELAYSRLKLSYNATLIVLNLDNPGRQWASQWFEDDVLQGIKNNNYDVAYDDGLYRAWYLAKNIK